MIAKLPVITAPPPRTDRPTSSAAPTTTQKTPHSFESTLKQSQRASRMREDERSAPAADRATVERKESPKREKLQNQTGKSEEVSEASVGEAPVISDGAAPADSSSSLPVEPANESEAGVVQEIVADVETEFEQQGVDASSIEMVAAMTVNIVADESSQQVAPTITATGDAAAQASIANSSPAMTMASAEAAKPQKNIAPSPLVDAVQENLEVGQGTNTSVVPTEVGEQGASGATGGESESDAAADAKPVGKVVDLAPIATALPDGSASLEPSISSSPLAAPSATGPSAVESIAARFAQLPQGDDNAMRDEANTGRIVRGLNSAINQRGGSVTLRLTPPDLGAVRIEMAVRDGVVSARFTAQTESVRNLLMDQMGQLRQALDRQGLSVEKIEVQVQLQPGASSGGFEKHSDDASHDGRSAGQYTSQQGGGTGSKHGGARGKDSFEQVMAKAAD